MIPLDPTMTAGDIVRTAASMREHGFTVAYVYAKDITDPARITDLLGAALTELA